jgi:hypothetical protein
VSVIDGGVADRVKSRAWTVRLTVAVCVITPLVPVITSWYVPAGAVPRVAAVSWELPPPATVAGKREALLVDDPDMQD